MDFFNKKFKSKPHIIEANTKVLRAGYYYAETMEIISTSYKIAPAKMIPGTYKIINGNVATAWGLMAAAQNSGLELFLGSYPITPATDILHEMSLHPYFGVKTFQAEDEIAGITSSIGAAFAGDLAVTTTSGPGLALKGEALGLAIMMELPLVVVNVQRGGPSTGLPTKTEQSDLLQALYGRNGESPAIVIAASTPCNSFDFAYEACRLALEHMTPVILLTDGYIANGSEPWKIKKAADLPEIKHRITKKAPYMPYDRDPETLARQWAIPGTPGLEHRLGGLEKDQKTGNVSYVPTNHEYMVNIRDEKIKRVQDSIPEMSPEYQEEGDLLVIGWGGTYGSLSAAVNEMNKAGFKTGHLHFNYINPLPKNIDKILSRFKQLVVCELNRGQMAKVLKINYPEFDYLKYNKIQGLPFTTAELMKKFKYIIESE
ncbi:MAG: MFS transporter [Flavobacteriales bacterium]|nr:MAG: MFS transporter [Flavobacteriales bacterium]